MILRELFIHRNLNVNQKLGELSFNYFRLTFPYV